jgi:endonuclease/exonuclease/phosphatase family metal-dependent hydrolase
VRLAAAGGPDLVALQEVPLWAMRRLAGWSGLRAVTAVTKPSLLGPLARRLHELDPVHVRSGLTGQANAFLVGPRLEIGSKRTVVMNPGTRRERRVCLLLTLRAGEARLVAACLHASIRHEHARRELEGVGRLVQGSRPAVVCGDFNVPGLGLSGFSPPLPGIDQVLVRGVRLVRRPETWPEERRRVGGVTLSDHAPVESVAELLAE